MIANDEDLLTITAANDVRFRVRIVRAGGAFGVTNSLVTPKDMVQFYDTRYDHTEFGQFVSSYYVETLLDDRCQHDPGYRFGNEGCRHGGLLLDAGSDDWWLDDRSMNVVRAWLYHETA